jgi:hypothetical protein
MRRLRRIDWRLLRLARRLPGPCRRWLCLGLAFAWFGVELILARMVTPARTLRCFQILWMFIQAQRHAELQLGPLLAGPPRRRAKLVRYARNCMVLVALQPELADVLIRAEADWLPAAAVYGACIPLFDGCLDRLPTRQARRFGQAVDQMLRSIASLDHGDVRLLKPLLQQYGAPQDDCRSWQALIDALACWLSRQSSQHRQLVLDWMIRMNEAQLASLGERDVTISLHQRRHLSSLKGGVSFLLLRALCLPDQASAVGGSLAARAALLHAAAVAQWIDDYADVREDVEHGIYTYIARLDALRSADATIREGLKAAAVALRAQFGHAAERFIDSLDLYYGFKRSARLWAYLERNLEAGR